MKYLILSLLLSTTYAQDPALPSGLGGDSKSDEPSFEFNADSSEMSTEEEAEEEIAESDESFFDYSGFIDMRAGTRLQSDPNQKDISLGEVRLHNELSKSFGMSKIKMAADLLGDAASDNPADTDLRDGTGIVDLRELNFSTTPVSFMDVKVGRQILTWGTGDLIFINDLFPKDWQAFFIGRDLTYLKAPSDAIKTSFYTPYVNLNVVYTPFFNGDRHIDGTKNSYYSPLYGKKVGRKTYFDKEENEKGELAMRLEKKIKSYELALYSYRGYWKSPMGFTSTGKYYHPELNVYGASVRGPLLGGVFNTELGYYDSAEETDGSNPVIPNDEFRILAGYEHELVKNTTGSVQYYVEHMMDYDKYLSTLSGVKRDESRHMVTAKVRRDMMKQTLALTAMVFYSPTDEDGHGRLNLDYKLTDDTKLFAGSNIFFGKQNNTFWGQFEDNTNVFAGVTINF